VGYAQLDAEDAHLAAGRRWWRHSRGYAATGRHTFLHRLVAGLDFGDRREVDHINGDKLDNRRTNLRLADRSMNVQNQHQPFRGAHYHADTGKWSANIRVAGVRYYLGLHLTQEDAASVAAEARGRLMPGSLEYLARSQSETAL
jgi:hypothetical protein